MPNANESTSTFTTWLNAIPELSGKSSPARLQALFSDIAQQKHANPAAYSANVSWWRNTLRSLLDAGAQPANGDHLSIELGDGLVQSFADAVGRRPLALTSVLAEMRSNGEVVELNTFLSSSSSPISTGTGRSSFLVSAVTAPVTWALQQLGLTDDGSSSVSNYESRWASTKGTYVHVGAVKDAARRIQTHRETMGSMPLSAAIHDRESFKDAFGPFMFPLSSKQRPTDRDLDVVLKYLQREERTLVQNSQVIKFVAPGEDARITELDKNFVELMIAARNLSKQTEELQSSIEERTTRAKEYVSKGRNEMAKSFLRSRKSLQELLVARIRSLETVQTVILKMETAAGDIQIMKAYETSSTALRDLLSHASLQRENVDQTMDRLSEALASHAEIEQAISIGGELARESSLISPMDEDEVDAELASLVRQEEQVEKVPSLPNAPNTPMEVPAARADTQRDAAHIPAS